MSRLSYRAFLGVLAAGRAIVWFLRLGGLGLYLHARRGCDNRLTHRSAARVVCLGLLIPRTLSLQGAVVNLPVQCGPGKFALWGLGRYAHRQARRGVEVLAPATAL